jgi:hypothetical protein
MKNPLSSTINARNDQYIAGRLPHCQVVHHCIESNVGRYSEVGRGKAVCSRPSDAASNIKLTVTILYRLVFSLPRDSKARLRDRDLLNPRRDCYQSLDAMPKSEFS